MNLFTIFILLSLIAFLGCEKDTMQQFNNVKAQTKNASTIVKNASNAENTLNEAQANSEALKKLTPFSSERFKAWLPDQVDNMPRKSYNFMTIIGSQGTAKFSDETGERTFEITVNDGAGEQGSALYMTQATLGGLYGNFETENDTKKEGIVKRSGIPSLETYYKEKNESSIRTTFDNRFIVTASGTHMNPDELYATIEKLNIEKLK